MKFPSFPSSSSSSPPLCIQEMENKVDRISNLPNSLIFSILSGIPTQYAVRTTILSKRWRNLWACTYCIDFDEDLFLDDFPISAYPRFPISREEMRRKFINYVHQTLLHHTGNQIDKFRLRMQYNGDNYIPIHQWISFAFKRGVQELDIDFSPSNQDDGFRRYELPPSFFSYSSLSILTLKYCEFTPFFLKIFSSLKTLCLAQIELIPDVLSKILENCLVLTRLNLEKCSQLSQIVISNSDLQLESLTIDDCKPLSEGILIHETKLRYFKYIGHVVFFYIGNMPCLNDVELDFKYQHEVHDNGIDFGQLLLDFNPAMATTVCSYFIQVFAKERGPFRSLPSSFYNIRHLILNTNLDNNELWGIACLLGSSPYLEILFLELGYGRCIKGYKGSKEDYWESQGLPFYCMLYHLKQIKMTGFQAMRNEIKILKYTLKNAKVLEKVIINTPSEANSNYRYVTKLMFEEAVMGFEMASSMVEFQWLNS